MRERSKSISRGKIDRIYKESYIRKHRLENGKNPEEQEDFYKIDLRPMEKRYRIHKLERFKKLSKNSETRGSKEKQEQIIKKCNRSIRINTAKRPRSSTLKSILIIHLYYLSKQTAFLTIIDRPEHRRDGTIEIRNSREKIIKNRDRSVKNNSKERI